MQTIPSLSQRDAHTPARRALHTRPASPDRQPSVRQTFCSCHHLLLLTSLVLPPFCPGRFCRLALSFERILDSESRCHAVRQPFLRCPFSAPPVDARSHDSSHCGRQPVVDHGKASLSLADLQFRSSKQNILVALAFSSFPLAKSALSPPRPNHPEPWPRATPNSTPGLALLPPRRRRVSWPALALVVVGEASLAGIQTRAPSRIGFNGHSCAVTAIFNQANSPYIHPLCTFHPLF